MRLGSTLPNSDRQWPLLLAQLHRVVVETRDKLAEDSRLNRDSPRLGDFRRDTTRYCEIQIRRGDRQRILSGLEEIVPEHCECALRRDGAAGYRQRAVEATL